MRRTCWSLVYTLLIAAPPLAAQSADRTWSIAATASLTGFRGAALDTTVDGGIAVRPSQGLALDLALARRWGPWALSIGANYLPTHIEAVSSDVAVQTRTESLDRVRLAILVGHRVAQVGSARFELRAGPVLDNWSTEGSDGRTTAGGQLQLALQLPVGGMTLENVMGFGWSPGPFREEELPAGYRREGLRTTTVGMGIKVGL